MNEEQKKRLIDRLQWIYRMGKITKLKDTATTLTTALETMAYILTGEKVMVILGENPHIKIGKETFPLET